MEENKEQVFTFSTGLSLEDIRVKQAKFAADRDWEKYHTPRNLLLALVGEVGELSELFQWRGEVEDGLPGWTSAEREHLGQELSDVLIYLIRLAERCHVDLPSAVLDKMVLNGQKYPVNRAHGSSLKYTSFVEEAAAQSKEP
ncbi:hypothetical protein EMCRGX_G024856 [Ephydatia muelleri]